MRKQLGRWRSLLFLSLSGLLWTGCSILNDNRGDACEPVYEPACSMPCVEPCFDSPQEVGEGSISLSADMPEISSCESPCCPPLCYPIYAAPPQPSLCGPSGKCASNGVMVQAKNPTMCLLGDCYPLDLEMTACYDVCDITLTAFLPEGVTFIRSEPEACVQGRQVIWQFGHLNRGQTLLSKIWLKCEREGDLCTCFCVKATPMAFCAVRCARPLLVCEKRAPTEVCPGQPIPYTVIVTNRGTCSAQDVLVTDVLPDGVEHASGQRTLHFRLGNLEPCQTKKIDFSVTACKRGQVRNTILVSARNANQSSCEACTSVCCCGIECKKIGPKEVPVGQQADYQITIVNTGDRTLREIQVVDSAPIATEIVTACGANIFGKQAIWRLRELCPAEEVTLTITLTTCTPGHFSNYVHVETSEGCQTACEFCTNWKGHPALDVCVTSCENPICLGETARFKIVVLNKGQEEDSNVQVVVEFPPELIPLDPSGATAGRIEGQTVEFSPFVRLAPDQSLEYYITVEAHERGDFRPKIEVSSDFIKTPITQEESLIVN